MTGYTVHTGSTEKFSQGWDDIFGKAASKKSGAKKAAAKKPAAKKAGKPKAAKKKGKK